MPIIYQHHARAGRTSVKDSYDPEAWKAWGPDEKPSRRFSHCTMEIEDPDACNGCSAEGGPMCGAVFIGDDVS
jgi:hypothetical protein